MIDKVKLRRAAAAVLFSLLVAYLLLLGGVLAGAYMWGHYGPPADDPDDIDALLCGLLVGGVMAIGGGVASLWKFWPRSKPKSSPGRVTVGGA